MSIFRLGDQKPPEPKRINDDVVMRFEHVFEVEPSKMQVFPQQDMPAWDTQRIVGGALGPPGPHARPLRGRGPSLSLLGCEMMPEEEGQ